MGESSGQVTWEAGEWTSDAPQALMVCGWSGGCGGAWRGGGVGSCLQKLLVTRVGEQGAQPDAVRLQLQEPVVALLDGAAQLLQGGGLLFLQKIQDLRLQLFDFLDDPQEAGVHLISHCLDHFLGVEVGGCIARHL